MFVVDLQILVVGQKRFIQLFVEIFVVELKIVVAIKKLFVGQHTLWFELKIGLVGKKISG